MRFRNFFTPCTKRFQSDAVDTRAKRHGVCLGAKVIQLRPSAATALTFGRLCAAVLALYGIVFCAAVLADWFGLGKS